MKGKRIRCQRKTPHGNHLVRHLELRHSLQAPLAPNLGEHSRAVTCGTTSLTGEKGRIVDQELCTFGAVVFTLNATGSSLLLVTVNVCLTSLVSGPIKGQGISCIPESTAN